jgi:hypothetical protein
VSAREKGCDPKSQQTATSSSFISSTLMVSERHPVGGGYSVQFRALAPIDGVLPIACEWTPTTPSTGDRLRKIDQSRYDNALAQFLEIAEEALGKAWRAA